MDILIDDREDEGLYRRLCEYDLCSTRARLEYGDACFEGNGPKGRVLVGIERKHLADIVDSLQSRRLSGHQLRGMWTHYDYCYLVVEDIWRPTETGAIEIIRGGRFVSFFARESGMTYRQVQNFLASLEVCGGVIVLRSMSTRETAAIYASLAAWWDKKWSEHHSHDEIYSPGPDTAQRRGKAAFITRQPGVVEKVAAQLPGIDRKAWDVGRKFGSVEAMVNASKADWMSIPGIGDGIASKVIESLHGEKRGRK